MSNPSAMAQWQDRWEENFQQLRPPERDALDYLRARKIHEPRPYPQTDLLEEAAEEGAARNALTQNICVHADWPWIAKEKTRATFRSLHELAPEHVTSDPDTAVYLCQHEYHEHLNDVLRPWNADRQRTLEGAQPLSNENVLFVTRTIGDTTRLVFHDSFDQEHAISSREIFPMCMETGTLAHQDMPRALGILGGLHPDDAYVFHGAELPCCTTEAARQIYALRAWGFLWEERATLDDESESYRALQVLADAMTVREETRMRFGVVFDPDGIYVLDGFQKNEFRCPSFTEELIQSPTKIFPSLDGKKLRAVRSEEETYARFFLTRSRNS